MADPDRSAAHARARRFVILLGWVSLFADLCYEGMRSAIGPYLALLGASATAVGAVAGTGEMIGFALRWWSGRLADKTQAYWGITVTGYALNVIAVPLLALASVAVLLRARRLYPDPRALEQTTDSEHAPLGPRYRVYMVGVALVAIGLADWPLLAFHFEHVKLFSTKWLPVVYAAAMAA